MPLYHPVTRPPHRHLKVLVLAEELLTARYGGGGDEHEARRQPHAPHVVRENAAIGPHHADHVEAVVDEGSGASPSFGNLEAVDANDRMRKHVCLDL